MRNLAPWTGFTSLNGQTFPGLDARVQGMALAQVLPDRKLRFEVFPGKTAAEVRGFTDGARVYER